jgi:hypothetical protein
MFIVMKLMPDEDDGAYFKVVGNYPKEFVYFNDASNYAADLVRYDPRNQYTIFETVAHATAQQTIDVRINMVPTGRSASLEQGRDS